MLDSILPNIDITAYITPTQLLGYLGLILGLVGVSQKNDTRFRIIMGSQALTLAIHFFMLGATSAGYVGLLVSSRNFISLAPINLKKLAPFYILAFVITGYLNYTHWMGLLPVTASILATIAMLCLSGVRMRVLFTFTSVLWLVHNVYYDSIGPSIMEGIMVVLGIITVYRLMEKKEKGAPIKDGERPKDRLRYRLKFRFKPKS